MAKRPIFIPSEDSSVLYEEREVEFEWYPGFALAQKQKSIESLHIEARKKGYEKVLEISTKSPLALGRSLSAFNLMLKIQGINAPVENFFQSSKVFEMDGPFEDLLQCSPKEAKRDKRLVTSGKLIKFSFFGDDWGLLPMTAFYDWLYIKALSQQEDLSNDFLDYSAFTDIEFNPNKSINCQARSAAIFVTLVRQSLLNRVLESKDFFISLYDNAKHETPKAEKENQEQLSFKFD
ncbi:MAG TPA: hypothetical protein PLU23_01245 [Anaerolineaceae bacterium]|jgi:hypothetical protein|nr:hypothetical protein [Anaerolineaceae bacterium]